jgi:hypothetical protein
MFALCHSLLSVVRYGIMHKTNPLLCPPLAPFSPPSLPPPHQAYISLFSKSVIEFHIEQRLWRIHWHAAFHAHCSLSMESDGKYDHNHSKWIYSHILSGDVNKKDYVNMIKSHVLASNGVFSIDSVYVPLEGDAKSNSGNQRIRDGVSTIWRNTFGAGIGALQNWLSNMGKNHAALCIGPYTIDLVAGKDKVNIRAWYTPADPYGPMVTPMCILHVKEKSSKQSVKRSYCTSVATSSMSPQPSHGGVLQQFLPSLDMTPYECALLKTIDAVFAHKTTSIVTVADLFGSDVLSVHLTHVAAFYAKEVCAQLDFSRALDNINWFLAQRYSHEINCQFFVLELQRALKVTGGSGSGGGGVAAFDSVLYPLIGEASSIDHAFSMLIHDIDSHRPVDPILISRRKLSLLLFQTVFPVTEFYATIVADSTIRSAWHEYQQQLSIFYTEERVASNAYRISMSSLR